MSAPLPPAALLEHSDFVRRLAWHLVHHDADADDVAQEALARAMARPAGGVDRVRPWLAGIVRHIASRLRRDAGRRDRRECAAARPEAIEGPDRLAARAETVRAVAAAVASLDEASRAVILLRHYDALPPRVIAARLGIPVETVNSRLKRAHARLRAQLERTNRPGRGTALAVLAGFNSDAGAPPQPPRIGSSNATGSVTLMAITTKQVGVVAALLLLALGGFVVLRQPSDVTPPGEDGDARTMASDASPGRDAPPAPPSTAQLAAMAGPVRGMAASTGEHAPPQTEEDATVATLVGALVSAETKVALPSVRFSLNFRRGDSAGKNVSIDTDKDGKFVAHIETTETLPLHDGWLAERRDLWIRRLILDTPAEAGAQVEIRPGATVRCTVEAAQLALVSGIVVDEEGLPLKGVRLTCFLPWANEGNRGSGMIHTTPDSGRFSISMLAHADSLLDEDTAQAACGFRVSLPMRPPLKFDVRRLSESERKDLRVVMPNGRRVRGRLVDEGGRGLAGYGVVSVTGDHEAMRFAKTDDLGGFTLEHLGDGPVTIGSFVPEHDLEARQDLTISGDLTDLVLVARSIDLSGPLRPVNVMGLRLVDVNDELRKAHDLPPYVHVMVVGSGLVGGFSAFGALKPGTAILAIGDGSVTSVKDLIDDVIAEHEGGSASKHPSLGIRIVLTQGTDGKGWTNTTSFSVGPRDVDQLRRVRASLR